MMQIDNNTGGDGKNPVARGCYESFNETLIQKYIKKAGGKAGVLGREWEVYACMEKLCNSAARFNIMGDSLIFFVLPFALVTIM